MTARAAGRAPQREQRKQDLLLASRLARGQLLRSLDEVCGQADGLARRIAQVRAWLTSPIVWMACSAAAALVASALLRRVRVLRLLRWAWLGLRVWRGAAALLAQRRALTRWPPASPAPRGRYDAPGPRPTQG